VEYIDHDELAVESYVAEQAGERLDVFLSRVSGQTRSRIQRLIELGNVTVNRLQKKAKYQLGVGDQVELVPTEPVLLDAVAENIPLDIVYQDADICVINKPKGMVVHPAPGHASGTLVNALLYHLTDLSGVGGTLRPGIVHRIDKMTSGLIVVAKNDLAHADLSAQIKEHSAGRIYLALVEGNLKEDTGTICQPIGRHPTDRKKMAIVKNGREAITHWSVLARFGQFTLVKAQLETGRTHQIRVHFSFEKHPVAGDTVYGPAKPKLNLDGQALHAYELHLTHPRTKERMSFTAPMPDYFTQALKRAGWKGEPLL